MRSTKKQLFMLIILLLLNGSWAWAEPVEAVKQDIDEASHLLLTYEKAGEKAIGNSHELKNKMVELKKLEEQREKASSDLGGSYPTDQGNGADDSARFNLLKRLKSMDASLEMAKREIEISKERIALETKNMKNEVNKLFRDKEITDLKLSIGKKELEMAQAKESRGLVSRYDLEKSQEAYETLLKGKEVLEKSIEASYIKLNLLLGMKDSESYILEEDVEYKPIEKEDLDSLSIRLANSNPNIWNQQKKIEMAELDLALYVYNAGGDSYAIKEIDLQLEKNNLTNLKKNLEASTKTGYTQIQQLEKNYELLEANVKSAERALIYVQAQYNVGMIVKLKLLEAELQVVQLKGDLKNRAIEHQKLKNALYKPYL